MTATSTEATSSATRPGAADGKVCFVIMPFGEKEHPVTKKPIDFDAVYHGIIKPAIKKIGLQGIRSDEENKTGLIHRDMIRRILDSAVAIVDITTGNPNVMYELGLRHTARRWGTIIIRQKGHDPIPFNINGLRALDYDMTNEESIEESINHLATQIRACLFERNVDSLVHTLFNGLNVSRRAIPLIERRVYYWHPERTPSRSFCIVTGSIQNIDMVDIWVNPENTKMQLGRYHDNSVSSYIRYWGARRNANGAVVEDIIHLALRKKLGNGFQVEPATVVMTHPGKLKQQNRVRAVLHVAAQHGEPGKGYTTIRSHMDCVTNALDRADEYNNGWLCRLRLRKPVRSIVFPLFGTRGTADDPQSVTTEIVQAAKVYMELWPDSMIERVYFLAYTDRDEELCLTAFQRLGLIYDRSEPEDSPETIEDPKAEAARSIPGIVEQAAHQGAPATVGA